MVRPVNPTTTGELPATTEFQLSAQDELIQLSEEELRKIGGGARKPALSRDEFRRTFLAILFGGSEDKTTGRYEDFERNRGFLD